MPQPRTAQAHTAAAAAVFSAAVLCAFPLYLDKYLNLGVVKFTAGATLCIAFCLWLAACCLVGALPRPGRFAAVRRDAGLWALAAFVLVHIISTAFSLDANASLWGLRGYYGGLVLVLYTAAAYLAVRAFADPGDLGGLVLGMGWAAVAITVLYVLNVFGLDPLGAYEGISAADRVQFFSTLGQQDFDAGALALLLPPVWYMFLTAKDRRQMAALAVPAVLGTLALVSVNADGLLLGVGAAALVGICCRGFCLRHLRRAMPLGAALFAWAGLLRALRGRFAAFGGVPLLAGLGAWALPGCLVCLLLWALLIRCPDLPLHTAGRACTALGLAAVLAALALANLWPGWSGSALDNFLVLDWSWGTGRGLAWQAAFGAWRDAPLWRRLLGYGPGMTRDAITLWAPGSGVAWPERLSTFFAAHNEYLEQLLTTGLLGLAAWAVFLIAHLRKAAQNWRRPGVAALTLALVSYLAQAAVSIRVSMLFPLVMLLFGWLAALCAPAENDAPAPQKRPKAAGPAPARRWAGICLAAFAAMWVCGALARVVFGFLY